MNETSHYAVFIGFLMLFFVAVAMALVLGLYFTVTSIYAKCRPAKFDKNALHSNSVIGYVLVLGLSLGIIFVVRSAYFLAFKGLLHQSKFW